MGYFKPPSDAFLSQLKRKNRRSAKEWKYVNAARVWADMAMVAICIAKTESATQGAVRRTPRAGEKVFNGKSRSPLHASAILQGNNGTWAFDMARRMSFSV